MTCGHSEPEVLEYNFDRFRMYLEAAQRQKREDLRASLEIQMVASRGSSDSVKELRKDLEN